MSKLLYSIKIKDASQNISAKKKNSEVFYKNAIFLMCFDDNVSVFYVLIDQMFWAS
jgi:hypothetical protein